MGSGSSGNAALLTTERTRLLIDAGLSRRRVKQRLEEAGLASGGLTAIVLTHEHADHASHAGKLAAGFGCPVYLTEGTWQALLSNGTSPSTTIERREYFRPGTRFQIGDIEVSPFLVSHDAREPVGFRFKAEGVRIAYALDLGFLDVVVKNSLRECDCILIEANYDIEWMRKKKAYPEEILQRIRGNKGHLSNDQIRQFVEEDFDGIARHLVLAHLSENNNLPELARMAVEQGLERRRARFPLSVNEALQIHVCPRTEALATIRF